MSARTAFLRRAARVDWPFWSSPGFLFVITLAALLLACCHPIPAVPVLTP